MGKHRLDNVVVCITCELGRKELNLKEIRQLKEQDVIELDKLAGEAFEIRMNGRFFAMGEAVVVTDMMAVRITDMAGVPQEVGA
jgi:flagellar motor switch protein FliN